MRQCRNDYRLFALLRSALILNGDAREISLPVSQKIGQMPYDLQIFLTQLNHAMRYMLLFFTAPYSPTMTGTPCKRNVVCSWLNRCLSSVTSSNVPQSARYQPRLFGSMEIAKEEGV